MNSDICNMCWVRNKTMHLTNLYAHFYYCSQKLTTCYLFIFVYIVRGVNAVYSKVASLQLTKRLFSKLLINYSRDKAWLTSKRIVNSYDNLPLLVVAWNVTWNRFKTKIFECIDVADEYNLSMNTILFICIF